MSVDAPIEFTPRVEVSPIYDRCNPSIYDPMKYPWLAIREAVMTAEQANFPKHPETEDTLFGLFFHPESTVGIVTDPSLGLDRLAGFSIVVPARVEYGLLDSEFSDRLEHSGANTAYVHCTQLAPEYQGHGLVGKLNKLVLDEVSNKGYDFLERDAMINNSYADKLLAAYDGRVVEHFPHDSVHGEQMFMRIRLKNQTFLYH